MATKPAPLMTNQRSALKPPAIMAKIMIVKRDGTATPYFWNDRDAERTRLTVYKETETGIKRMMGVHFDATTNRIHKHPRA